jgi:Trypsin-like peptidase domain
MKRPPGAPRALHAAAGALLAALVLIPAQRALAQEDEEAFHLIAQDSQSMTLNEVVEDQKFQEVRKGVFWQMPFGQMHTRYIRFRFDNIKSPPGASYSIRVLRLPLEEEVARYPASAFANQESFMTGLLPSGELRIELAAESAPTGLSFRLERAVWRTPPHGVTVHSPIVSTMLITFFPQGSAMREPEHSVALLHIGPTEVTCTGVLIDEQTLATNHHCLQYSLAWQQSKQSATPSCQDIVAEFDFLAPNQRGASADCVSVKTDEALDIALLTLDRKAAEIGPETNRQPVKVRPASEGMPEIVRLVHHPLGFPLAIQEHCRVRKVEQTDIFHDCGAANGSSGSPLFDEQMRLVGIHYKGAYPRTWTNEQQFADMQKNGPKYNRARTAAAVLEFLKK